jgi:hypothetical protein
MFARIVVSIVLTLTSVVPAAPGKSTSFKVLAEGWQQGNADARETVIRDASSLQTVWDELHARPDQPPGSGPAVPKVDFTTHVVVLIRLEPQTDTDTRVEATRVVREAGRAGETAHKVVTVEEWHREAGCMMIGIIQHVTPYTLVEIAGTQEEVVVRHVMKEIPCGSYIPPAPKNPGVSRPRRGRGVPNR